MLPPRRWLGSLVACALLCTSLTGCPGSGSEPAASPPPGAPPPSTPPSAPAPVGGGAPPTVVGQIDRTELKVRMMKVKQAAEAFRALEGRWPKTIQELVKGEQLTAADAQDPWERDFKLVPDGPQLTVESLGQDGQPGGEGLDADLTSADLF